MATAVAGATAGDAPGRAHSALAIDRHLAGYLDAVREADAKPPAKLAVPARALAQRVLLDAAGG